ncbi:MAG: chorismate mutase [Alphaproteobacteria bacterium]|nr:chorismate mutase [Alphaproteobacteria bacterium]
MTDTGDWPGITDRQQPLAVLRAEIDDIDTAILALIARRMVAVRTVAEQKIQQGLVFRARREIEKIRTLEAIAQRQNIPSAMAFDLWRIIMSQALYQQRPFRLICLGSSSLAEVALAHFGRDIPLTLTTDLDWTLAQQRAAPTEVMCLFDKQRSDWWHRVVEAANLSIIAEVPWRNDGIPTGYLLAQCPVDLDADAEILCTLYAPDVDWLTIAEVLKLPVLNQRQDADSGRWLIRLIDTAAYASPEAMLAQINHPLPSSWSLGWLGRFPRFHRRQPGA